MKSQAKIKHQPIMSYEGVMRRVEDHIRQLETMAHACNEQAQVKAYKLCAQVEECLAIAGTSMGQKLRVRYRQAVQAVMKPRPQEASINLDEAESALGINVSGSQAEQPVAQQTAAGGSKPEKDAEEQTPPPPPAV